MPFSVALRVRVHQSWASYRLWATIVIASLTALLGLALFTSLASAQVDFVSAIGTPGDASFRSPSGIAVGPDGAVYVSDTGNNRIQKFAPSGTFIAKWGSGGADPGQLDSPLGLATDALGNVYVADSGNGRIQKFSSDGVLLAVMGATGTGAGEFQTPSGVAVDSAGNIYVADTGNNRIQKLGTDGSFLAAWGKADHTAGSGEREFSGPRGVAAFGGSIYVADTQNSRVQKLTDDGVFVELIGVGQIGMPFSVSVGVDALYVADGGLRRYDFALQVWTGLNVCCVSEARGVAVAGDAAYVTSSSFASVVLASYSCSVDPDTDVETCDWSVSGGIGRMSGGADGEFGSLQGVAADPSSAVYAIDDFFWPVQRFDRFGLFENALVHVGNVSGARGVSTDPAGYVYVTSGPRTHKFRPDGAFVHRWGKAGTADGELIEPSGVASDSAGNIYVADTGNSRIQRFSSAGDFRSTWGTFGSGEGELAGPTGLAVDSAANVYVADTGNNRIQKFATDGTFLARWGRNSGDGSAGSGEREFSEPRGVAVDFAGNVYVADTGNNRIQKLSPSGAFLAEWGTLGVADDQFREPNGVAVDCFGDVYVADHGNALVKKFHDDATPLNTCITASPFVSKQANDAMFEFAANKVGATFECSLDGGPFESCTSPVSYASLSEGEHAFAVRATDAESNIDQSEAIRTWSVDTVAPDTSITSAPSGMVGAGNVTFEFSSSEPDSTFECKVDTGAFSPCDYPHTYSASDCEAVSCFTDGEHTFAVRATDPAGNTDPSDSTHTFTVDAIGPETLITSAPANTTGSTSATFEFTSDPPGASFECKLDSFTYAPCSSPQTYMGLSGGGHTFSVRAVDALGDVDPTPATKSWEIDIFPPETFITGHPPLTTIENTAGFNYSSPENLDLFECKLDDEPFVQCDAPEQQFYGPLAQGAHTFQVRAYDLFGNRDPTPAVWTWTIVEESSQQLPSGGGTISTGGAPTPSDPIETELTSPNAGTVSITETPASGPAPSGFDFLDWHVEITAPTATVADPLTLIFRIDASLLPAGVTETNLEVFKDGLLVPACSGAPGAADPDPCIAGRARLGGGDVQIIILSSSASDWTFGVAQAPCTVKVTTGGWIVTDDGDRATFGGTAKDTATAPASGQENYQDNGPASPMTVKSIQVRVLSCSPDLKRASIFGTAKINNRGTFDFRIDVQDLAEPGKLADTYRMLLDNGYDSGEHRLRGGNIQIH